MKTQVKKTVTSGYLHLRNVGRVRRNLTPETCAKLINSTVTVRLDYQNALLAGCYRSVTEPLQRLQNHAARLLSQNPRYSHITPILRELHWLPIRERCNFKLLVLIHEALYNDAAPAYLKEMFTWYTPARPLRTEDARLICNPRFRTYEGQRSAPHHGAVLWNDLPFDLRKTTSKQSFKKKLKTVIFTRYFSLSFIK